MIEESETTIEFAKYSDANEIGQLSKMYVEHGLGWSYTPKKLRRIINDKNKIIVAARRNNKLVGFGIMTYHQDNANLDLLAVIAMYRRQGIGKKIVIWLEKVAEVAGIFNIFVQARKNNRIAIEFYKNLGYHTLDEVSGYYRKKESGVIMSKTLRNMINTT